MGSKKDNNKLIELIKSTEPVELRKVGRPSEYSKEIDDKICFEIATSSKGLNHICNSDNSLPSAKTVWGWMLNNEEFRNNYIRAKEAQAFYIHEEIIEIADDSSNDTEILHLPSGPKEIENREWTSRSKLRVDARLKLCGQLNPKKYGSKLDVTIKKLGKDLEDNETYSE